MHQDAATGWLSNLRCTPYTVKRNETLFDILRKFDISIRALKESNPECDLLSLQTGQVITVCRENGELEKKSYILEQDEDLSTVAIKFNLSVIALLKANPHLRPLEIREGIAIYLPE